MTRPSADVVLGGRYRLIQPIAQGGMGTVWLAEDETLDRRVAVKVLNDGLADDPQFLERFRREARAAAGLSHVNVAGVFDYGEDGSRPFIVMELVEGETVAERLERTGPFDPAEAAAIGASVADALAEAHAAGVVHRDVKPGNVILSKRGIPKVTDFGIASSGRTTNLTAAGMVMGTARYLSPEQARGDRATGASDLYGLGVLLYEMLAGEPPFDLETPVATAMAHVRDTPKPLREARPDVPPALAAIVEAALDKDPARRPASAQILAAELRAAALDPSPASATGAVTETISRDPTAVLPAAEPPAPGLTRRHRAGRRFPAKAWLIPLVMMLMAAAAVVLIIRVTDKPPPRVSVPAFTELTRAQAVARAQNSGLELTFTQRESDAPKGRVIAQSPKAGTRIVQGSTVALVLSTGPPMTTVPTLAGLTSEKDVLTALTDARLTFGGTRDVPGPPGIVGSDPEAGASVPEGTAIVILIGAGEDEGNGNGDGRGNDKKDKDED